MGVLNKKKKTFLDNFDRYLKIVSSSFVVVKIVVVSFVSSTFDTKRNDDDQMHASIFTDYNNPMNCAQRIYAIKFP